MMADPVATARPEGARTPYDAPELYDELFDALTFDVPFWTQVGREAAGPVLDVACGTGRVTLPLLAAGVDVDGLDLHPAMIARLRSKAAARGLSPHLVVAPMQEFTMPRRYARAICAFNAFAHHDTTDDQLRTLRCVREHLEPGGAFVLHMSYPGSAYWTEPDGVPVLETEFRDPERERTLQLWDTRFRDPVAQCQRSEVEVRELNAGGGIVGRERFHTTQRWVYRYELELLFRAAGYSRSEIFGGFAGEPLERDDQQMLAWAWRD